MLNLTNNAAKQRYLQEMTRQQIILERTFIKRLSPIIKKQFLDSASVVRRNSKDINYAVNSKRGVMIKEISSIYKRTAVTFKSKVDKVRKKDYSYYEHKKTDDVFWSSLRFWLDTYAARKVAGVNETTRKAILAIIKKGMEREEANADIADKLADIGDIASKSRAATIARTETHGAAIMAIDSAIRDYLGESAQTKEWLAANDERTREDHADVSGDIVGMDESFSVGDEEMEYPGDPSASAGQVVNCRCVVMYHTNSGDIEGEGGDNE